MKDRLRAFAVHLVLSALVVLTVLVTVSQVWYPGEFLSISGGWQVLKVLILVDLVLGPLLTLILFKTGKPGLKFDLACVALLQIVALGYGVTIIYQQRPEFLVFNVDRFTAVASADIEHEKIRNPDQFKERSILGPVLAIARIPQSAEMRSQVLFSALSGQRDVAQMAQLYAPYQPDVTELAMRSIEMPRIVSLSSEAKSAVEQFLNQRDAELLDYIYLPLEGRNKHVVVAVSRSEGALVGIIDIDPWLDSYRTADGAAAYPKAS